MPRRAHHFRFGSKAACKLSVWKPGLAQTSDIAIQSQALGDGLLARLDPRCESDIGWLSQLITELCEAAWRGEVWSAWAFWIEAELFEYETGPPVREKVAPEF